ncbi:WecB/TagA/CpsF family glycosyltransferase [Psychrosphaera ytuae]|uniref:WecB/TagA/CpsF family glycosyltransferase n=2 Tax=Psychrosphaera ytuae TaxID=2820710 RepID=A0A975DGL2_9GAMM|nr:WecB/TagA/CpsF family glycosyltransferase [Psychrosphaera ytuae]
MHPLTMDESVDVIKNAIEQQRFFQHVVVNVAKLVNMRSDRNLFESVNDSDLINIDGQGVVLGARAVGIDVPERVAGIDLFHQLVSMSSKEGFPIYLLGAEQSVLVKTKEVLEHQYPNLIIAGSHHGYFDDEKEIVAQVRASGAKLMFVAMSSPKKENFINTWKSDLGVNFVMGVGGTFDVIAGKVKRAPVWMQKYGLEWLYRVIQEPRRMFKRYLVTNTKFALLLLKEVMLKELLFKNYKNK